jgi:dihydroorotate dehydrogenase
MNLYKTLVRPVLFQLDAEWVHDRAIATAAALGRSAWLRRRAARRYRVHDPRLETEVAGLPFANPIGLAAGYDKSARAVPFLACAGVGFVEIGSVSAEPSAGNPKPRLFRLPRDQAIIVNYGLPNDGADVVARRLAPLRLDVPLGVNIVKTNRLRAEPDDTIIDDYVRSVRRFHDHADYLNLNLSCPNTEMGRDFFAIRGNTRRLMDALSDLPIRCPVFLKVSPLGGDAAIDRLLDEVRDATFVAGFMFNLPPGKPDGLRTPRATLDAMPGTATGRPVAAFLRDRIRRLFERMDTQRYRLIGAGGVFSADDAYRIIRLGASLVQVYTALIFEGPGVVRRINEGLARLLERDGFRTVADAVGVDVRTEKAVAV